MKARRRQGIRARGSGVPTDRRMRISLLGGFQLENGHGSINLPQGSQRLLAFLALKGRAIHRETVAGTLWPEATEAHASSSLRSTLTRLPGEARFSVTATPRDVGLADGITVDLWDARTLAQQLLAPSPTPPSAEPGPDAVEAFSTELLPDWYEEWAIVEAEDWRQLRLHALEALAGYHSTLGNFGWATAAARAAVRAEPLRETSWAALIQVHIAEGNPSEALREFTMYRELLQAELGVEPTGQLRGLVADLWSVTPR